MYIWIPLPPSLYISMYLSIVLGSQQDPDNGGELHHVRFVGSKPSNISFFDDDARRTYKIVMSRDEKDTPHNEMLNRTIIGHLDRSWKDGFF